VGLLFGRDLQGQYQYHHQPLEHEQYQQLSVDTTSNNPEIVEIGA
jgi:hypothetical protein